MEEKNTQVIEKEEKVEDVTDIEIIAELEVKERREKAKEGKIITIVCVAAMIIAIGYGLMNNSKTEVKEDAFVDMPEISFDVDDSGNIKIQGVN